MKTNDKRNFKESKSKGSYKDKPDYRSRNGKDEFRNRGKRNSHRKDYRNKEDSERIDEAVLNDSSNNPKWYVPDQISMEQAVGFTFSNFLGRQEQLDFMSPGDPGYTHYFDHVGTIMNFNLNPSPGNVGTNRHARLAAINQQGFKLYARLSAANSKNTQYAPQDVTTLVLGMGEMISLISWVQRCFGLCWIYDTRNRMLPKRLIQASGFDAEDLFAHLPQYRQSFNLLLVEANKITFPSNIDYFLKCGQLYSNVYRDCDTEMSQLYICRPYSTWELDETGAQGTVLKTKVLPYQSIPGGGPAACKMSDVLDILRSIITDMLTSATYNYIYSDIITYVTRSSGNANMSMLHFESIPEGYTVIPVYDEPFLSQINNLSIIGVPESTVHSSVHNTINNDVVPNMTTLALEYKPAFVSFVPWGSMSRYINFHVNNPDSDARIEATRLSSAAMAYVKEPGATAADADTYVTDLNVLGDHYVVTAEISTDEDLALRLEIQSSSIELPSALPSQWYHFKDAPIMYTWTGQSYGAGGQGSGKICRYMGEVGDLDFFTTVDPSTLNRINEL